MKMIQGTTTKKGQTTIPAAIRRRLGLESPGRYMWVIDQDEIRIKPAEFTLESAYASLPFRLDTEEIEQAITEARQEQTNKQIAKLHRP